MNPRRLFRVPLAIVLIAGLLPVTIETVIGAMSARTIEGQDGWSGGTLPVSAGIDQAVDQSGLNQRTGTGAWRISNNTSLGGYNGNFAGWVFGPGLPVSAGQPASGAVTDQFTATLWFRSASAAADGSNIEIDLGSVAGDDRNTFLALTNRADADGGLQLRVSEPDGATGNFRPTAIVATAITRNAWHRLDIVANFADGPTNDTVAYTLDGAPLVNPVGGGTTFGTFEGFREGIGSPYVQSNRLYFRSGAAPSAYGAFADTAAQGFYFDDLFYAVADQSAPAFRLAAYATGFEPGYSAGSIEGQEGWSGGVLPIAPSVDQTVDLSGVNQRTGLGSWRISNSTSLGNYNGNFPGWPFSPPLLVSAGQPLSAAGADQFTATLWFRSASAAADGSYIEIDLGNDVGDNRTTFLALANRADGTDGGLQLRAAEPDTAGVFLPTEVIAPGITRSEWHRLDIVARFVDGAANDTVEFALDGLALPNPAGGTRFRTFESYYALPPTESYPLSNRLFFRSSRPPSGEGAFVDTDAQGFYFDDLFYAVANQSAPATQLAAYATGFEPPAVPAPDLMISKSHVGNFTQGQTEAPFTITVTNIGSLATFGGVTLTDTTQTGLTPTAGSGAGWTCVSGATVTCTRSDALAPGASYPPLTITVDVAASAPASTANTATISGGGDVSAANNTATDPTTILAAADLTVTKSHVGSFTQGQAGATYTLAATNAGGSPTIGTVSVVDAVPAGLTPMAASGTGWTCTVAGATVTCSRSDALAPLASVAPVTVTVDVAPDAPASVTNTATISGGGEFNTTNNAAADVTTILPASSSLSLYFAEGATGFFTTSIDLVNPSASDTATATMTFVGDSGPIGTKAITLAAGASQSVSLNAEFPTVGGLGTIVESNIELAGERHMSWGEGGYGSSLERGVRQAATTWYFAEGATNGFDLYYLLLNPGTTAADVTIQFLLDDGPPLTKTVTVAPRSRTTLRILDYPDPELQAAGFGAVLTSTVPIVAEQTMYSSSPTQFFGAGSASAATPALATTVHFAEGATGFFDEFLALINPSPSAAATATILYRLPDGTTLSKAYPIAPERRLTVWLNQEARTDPALAALASTAVAVTVTSDQPIAVTRKMYWPSPLEPGGWGESSDVGGITTTTLKAYVARATVGGADDAATYVLIANTSTDAGQIQVTATPAGGTPVVQTYPIPANARLTVDLAWFGFVDQPFSVAIESLASPLAVPIVVEVASYSSPGGQFWAAGSASAASVPQP